MAYKRQAQKLYLSLKNMHSNHNNMSEKRLYRLLELLQFYSDSFARIAVMNRKEIGDVAVKIISSILNYEVAILFMENERGETDILSHIGTKDHVSMGESYKEFTHCLWKTIEAPEAIQTEDLKEDYLTPAFKSDIGGMFLVAPMKILVQNRERIIGFALAAKPADDYEAKSDLMVLDIIASLITGALSNFNIREKLISANEGLRSEILERSELQTRLMESENQKQAILDASVDMIMVADTEMRVMWANKKAAAVANTTLDKIIGRKCHEFFQNSDTPCPDCPCERALKTGQVEYGLQYQPAMNFVGESYWEDYGIPIKNALGEITGVIEIARNATDKVKAELELRESRELYRTIFENTGNATLIVEDDMMISLANTEFEYLSGYAKNEIEGKKMFTEFIRENDRERIKEYHFLRNILSGPDSEKSEAAFVDRIGNVKDTIVNIAAIPDTKKSVVSLVDISEHKKLKSQLFHAQKMEAIGQLAGGIAHDFNNILTAIIGYAHFMKLEVNQDAPLKRYIENIIVSSEHAAKLTKRLLAFSRKQTIDRKPVNVNSVVSNIEKLVSRVLGEDIEISIALADEELFMSADQYQLEQVMVNLINNARDAMPRGGSLIIQTEAVNIDNEFVKRHGYGKPGAYVCISVEDTGHGMDPATKEKIFDPFFTTKEVGKGTGLGLSMAYGIIKQHDGFITVYSDPGIGTTFKIFLPLIRPGFEKEIKEISTTGIFKGTETVLLAEDNDNVRDLLKEVLKQSGYNVIEAVDGKDAVDKFVSNKDRIQLLILDIIMPQKNGKEAFEEISAIRPGIKTIFMSGYTADIIKDKGFIGLNSTLISKPLVPTVFLKSIREVLDNQNGGTSLNI
jgi:two-component system cell cycle sensor histidine kinase/response regulator CckA